MNALAFDTLKFPKRLKEAGFTEQQAEALAEAEAELFEAHLASKQDVANLQKSIEESRTELKRDFGEVQREIEQVRGDLSQMEQIRTELKRDLKDLEARMIIKLGGLLALAVGIVAALVRLL